MKYEFIEKGIWIREKKILVVTDLHLGYEEALNENGVFFPKQQYKKMREDFKEIFNKTGKLCKIIILGDFKHKFRSINNKEWVVVLEFLEFLKENTGEIIITRGNHDVIIEPIERKEGVKVVDYYILEELGFLHGDKSFIEIFDKKIRTIFMGHLHPSASLEKDAKTEKYKCFLVGEFKGKEIIILPSFFPLIEGSDVAIEETNLAFDLELDNFKVYIPVNVNEVLEFGKLKSLKK